MYTFSLWIHSAWLNYCLFSCDTARCKSTKYANVKRDISVETPGIRQPFEMRWLRLFSKLVINSSFSAYCGYRMRCTQAALNINTHRILHQTRNPTRSNTQNQHKIFKSLSLSRLNHSNHIINSSTIIKKKNSNPPLIYYPTSRNL